MQALYQYQVRNGDVDDILHFGWLKEKTNPQIIDFSKEMFLGTIEHLDEIDQFITGRLKDWSMDRLGQVERSILRFSVYEIIFISDIPRQVTINEAVFLAKKFCDSQSYKFINGVLDGVHGTSVKDKPQDSKAAGAL